MTKSVTVQHVKNNIRAIRCISPRRTSRPTRQAARMTRHPNPGGGLRRGQSTRSADRLGRPAPTARKLNRYHDRDGAAGRAPARRVVIPKVRGFSEGGTASMPNREKPPKGPGSLPGAARLRSPPARRTPPSRAIFAPAPRRPTAETDCLLEGTGFEPPVPPAKIEADLLSEQLARATASVRRPATGLRVSAPPTAPTGSCDGMRQHSASRARATGRPE
jgi:hypothetical protein